MKSIFILMLVIACVSCQKKVDGENGSDRLITHFFCDADSCVVISKNEATKMTLKLSEDGKPKSLKMATPDGVVFSVFNRKGQIEKLYSHNCVNWECQPPRVSRIFDSVGRESNDEEISSNDTSQLGRAIRSVMERSHERVSK